MKKFNINTIIHEGIEKAPRVGISGAFHAYQFCDTRKKWKDAFNKAAKRGAQCFAWVPKGNNSPIGDYFTKTSGNYVYLYVIDSRGDWESVAYTHVVIAGGNL